MRNSISALLVATGLSVSGMAMAVTLPPVSFTVTATVNKICTGASATNLAFGGYTPGAGTVTASSAISVKCTKTTPFTVSLSAGTTTGGTMTQRLMTDASSNTLQYNLYTTSGLSTVFGDGTLSSQTQGGTGIGLGTAVSVGVFGQLPDNATNQNAAPGSYSDTITATITY